ncbi:Hypothetical predicted protein [Pelobates cultripes]|uniref:Uncharacterized protein n=1 Tax=Pelobates cultripes TaxID=61616 RepID=A0AAD1WIV1_PELCU|nr:Hypothetical predicted protein [Pelobates cultripes]
MLIGIIIQKYELYPSNSDQNNYRCLTRQGKCQNVSRGWSQQPHRTDVSLRSSVQHGEKQAVSAQFTLPLQPYQLLKTMGRKSKKYQTEKHPTTADIGELLWRPQASLRPVMELLSNAPSRSSSEDSLSNLEMMAETQRAGKPKAQNNPPVTEDRLKALLDDLRRHIAADINSFKEEINGVSVKLHDTEISTAAHEARINSLES